MLVVNVVVVVAAAAQLRTGEIQLVSLEENAASNRKLGAMIRGIDWAKNSGRFLYNWTAGWVAAPLKYTWSEIPLNLGEIINVVNQVLAHAAASCLWSDVM